MKLYSYFLHCNFLHLALALASRTHGIAQLDIGVLPLHL
jgi:hypothetical protein